jgi:hypothetical protein
MDPATISLIFTQIVTLFLLIISEFLSLSDSPYSGILHAIVENIEKKIRTDTTLNNS